MNNPHFAPSAISAGECISGAWELLKKNYGMYLGISLITMIMTGCIPCLNIFIMGPVMGGVYYVVLRDMRGEPVDFGMMFKGFEKFVPLMVIGLIQSIPGILAQFVQYGAQFADLGLKGAENGDFTFYQASGPDFAISSGVGILIAVVVGVIVIVGLLWWAMLFFAIPLAMEHDLGAVDAMKLSARAAMSNLGGLIVLVILEVLVMLLGIVMICLGVFLLSLPIIYLANVFAYRQVFPWVEQQFNMAPPPPNYYGSSFGREA